MCLLQLNELREKEEILKESYMIGKKLHFGLCQTSIKIVYCLENGYVHPPNGVWGAMEGL